MLRRASTGTESKPVRVLLSAFILAVLATQAVASFGGLHRFYYWPFLSYPMYDQAHRAGEAVPNYALVAIDVAGREHPLTARDLDLDFWRMLRGPVRSAQRGDNRELLRFLEPFERRTHVRVAAVRIENHPIRLTDGRLEPAEPETSVVTVRPA